MNRSSARKPWLVVLAALAVFALIAASCGGDSDGGESGSSDPSSSDADNTGDGNDPDTTELTAPEPGTGEVTEGGRLVMGLEAPTDGLDPTSSAFAASAYQISRAVYEPLAAFTADGELVPYLAESWEVSDDLMTWDITLRSGIKFHDGTELTAEAAVVTTERAYADPLVGLALKTVLPPEEPRAEALDDLTVRFHLIEPNATFPAALTGQLGFAASPDWLNSITDTPEAVQEPVGTGPYRLKSRQQGDRTVLERNPDWWQTEQFGIVPPLDEIEFVVETDSANRVDLLETGAVDAMHTTQMNSVKALEENDDVYEIPQPMLDESFVMINTTETVGGAPNPFSDIRVREALTLSTPKQDYIDAFGEGLWTSAESMFNPESTYHNPDITQVTDDAAAAADLVAAVCADNPSWCSDDKINMSFTYAGPSVQQDEIAAVLGNGWSTHFNVTNDIKLQDEYIQLVALGAFQVVTWRQFGNRQPAVDALWVRCESIGLISLNWPRFCDDDRDAIMDTAIQSTDEAERIEAWKQVAADMNEDFLYVFLVHTRWYNAIGNQFINVCEATTPEGEKLACATNGVNWLHSIGIAG